MATRFSIPSSDPALLEKASTIAQDLARQYMRGDVAGIVFLGAIARGYFDPSADIDIALFKQPASSVSLASQYLKVEGLEIHCHLADYEEAAHSPWDMAKRWTYSQGRICFDPEGQIAKLLQDKVPLRPDERRWLLMSGLALSEWYINRLSQLWVERGSLVSAHSMFAPGLDHFLTMLFALNHELVADVKWRYYCAEQLERLPPHFRGRFQEAMLARAFSAQELERRRGAFMAMWHPMASIVEKELDLSYEELKELV